MKTELAVRSPKVDDYSGGLTHSSSSSSSGGGS